MAEPPSVRQRALWDRAAAAYDSSMALLERRWLGAYRGRLLGHASGLVVEAGIGTGANLPHYPAGVELIGFDASPAMLGRAARRAAGLGRTARLAQADADRLPVSDGSADTVVATLLLCSVPRVETTLAEFARVLRPGGRLLLLDHVESSVAPLRGLQSVADRVTRATGECWRRRPAPLLAAAGFDLVGSERSRARLVEAVVAELVSRS